MFQVGGLFYVDKIFDYKKGMNNMKYQVAPRRQILFNIEKTSQAQLKF